MTKLARAFLALLLLSAPLWAAGAASTSVVVTTKSDHVDILLQSGAPMTFKEKMLNPSLMAIEVSPAVLKAGTPKKIAVDKGLIQSIALEQRGDTVTIKVAVISRPKQLRAALEAGGKKLTLRYSTADIATAKPAGFSSVAPGKPSKPTASQPKAVPAIRPGTPAPGPSSGTVPVRPLSPTVTSSVPTQPVASAPPAGGANGMPRISLTFSQAPLVDVFVKLADEAGLNPVITSDIEGSFSGSFSNEPLDSVLRTVCKGRNVNCEVSGGNLKVTVTSVAGTAPAPGGEPAVPSVVASAPDPVLPAGPLAREYYPIRRENKASEVVNSARSLLPNVRYTVDERLNVVMAEGSPTDIERLTGFLKEVSAK